MLVQDQLFAYIDKTVTNNKTNNSYLQNYSVENKGKLVNKIALKMLTTSKKIIVGLDRYPIPY